MIFKLAIGLAALLAVVILVLAFQNMQPASLNLFGAPLSMPLGITMIGAWVAGLVASVATFQTRVREVKEQQALQKWEVQDNKLALEVESDKIKQLEAKILTLETALKRALKKD